MKCPQCRHEMVRTIENHRYAESGLSNVVLVGVEVQHCQNCGENLVSIPRIEGLHRAIAMALIRHPGSCENGLAGPASISRGTWA
jgi:YgiT-type zinc finger domain-containing protein